MAREITVTCNRIHGEVRVNVHVDGKQQYMFRFYFNATDCCGMYTAHGYSDEGTLPENLTHAEARAILDGVHSAIGMPGALVWQLRPEQGYAQEHMRLIRLAHRGRALPSFVNQNTGNLLQLCMTVRTGHMLRKSK